MQGSDNAADPVIEVHSAFVPKEYVELMARRGERYGMRLVEQADRSFLISDRDVPVYGPGTPIPLSTQHSDPDLRLRDMSRMGVDVQVLTPPTNVFHYWQPPELGREIAELVNNGTAEVARARPEHFIGIGIAPLQDTQLALQELDRMVGLGLRAVEIGSSVNGEELDSPRLFPFFERAAALDLPVFIHGSELPDPRRFHGYSLATLLGIPMATTIAGGRLIFSGVLERLPGLKLCLSHAGGVLPYLHGRLDHGYDVKSASRAVITQPPGGQLRRLYYDTISFSTLTLRYLSDVVGVDQVLLGSDYPFDDGDPDPVGSVMAVPGLTREARAAILGGNAARLLKYDLRGIA